MRCFSILLGLLLWPALTLGDCRQRGVQVQPAAVAVEAVTLVPIAVQVPAYQIGYQAPAQDLRQVLDEIQKLRQEIEDLRRGQPQALKVAPHLAILGKHCAACHDRTTAAAKGGKLTLLDAGQLAPLTPRQLLRVGTQTYLGHMPKVGKISDEEVGQIQAWLDAQP